MKKLTHLTPALSPLGGRRGRRAGGFCNGWLLRPETGRGPAEAVFEMFEDVDLVAGEGGFEAVGKANEEMFLGSCRSASPDADPAPRMDKGVCARHFAHG